MAETKHAGPAANGTGAQMVSPTSSKTTYPDPVIATMPAGRAYAGPPCPGRRLWLVAVLSCPLCSGMHQHRVYEAARLLSGRAVRCCPTTGRPYVLAPVQRRREAVRRAAQ